MDEPEPVPDRKELADLIRPLGPLVGLGEGDPVTIRSILRKVGLSKIVIEPDGLDGWKFTGPAHLIGLAVHKRTQAAPPPTRPPVTRAAHAQDRAQDRLRRISRRS